MKSTRKYTVGFIWDFEKKKKKKKRREWMMESAGACVSLQIYTNPPPGKIKKRDDQAVPNHRDPD
jgi:hypothetical protein